jgi:hypothetical protein
VLVLSRIVASSGVTTIGILVLALGIGVTGSGLQGLLMSRVYRGARSSRLEGRIGSVLWRAGIPFIVVGVGLVLVGSLM